LKRRKIYRHLPGGKEVFKNEEEEEKKRFTMRKRRADEKYRF